MCGFVQLRQLVSALAPAARRNKPVWRRSGRAPARNPPQRVVAIDRLSILGVKTSASGLMYSAAIGEIGAVDCDAGTIQFGSMPAFLTTPAHIATSDFRRASSSSGEQVAGSPPSSIMRVLKAVSLMMARSSLLRKAMISFGVPDGATSEFQPSTVASRPNSRMVGTLGCKAERLLPEEAMARMFLASIADFSAA